MSSGVWMYFKIDSNEKFAKCSVCNTLISRGGSSKTTSNLIKHLKKVHHINLGSNDSNKPKASVKNNPSPGSGPSKIVSFFQPQSKSATATSVSPARPSCSISHASDFDQSIDNLPSNMEELGVEIDPDDPAEYLEFDTERPLRPSSCSSASTCATSPNLDFLSGTMFASPISEPRPSSRVSLDSESSVSATGCSPQETVCKSMYPKTIKLGTKKKQPTLHNVLDKVTKFKSNDQRAKEITKLICEMVCLDLQPLSVMENKGFRKLINHLEPRYTIPSRKMFSNKILVDMYDEVRNKVKEELQLASHVAITTDMWTSIANEDYMAVTVHFYSGEDYYLKITHRCLEVVPFTEVSHTASNLITFLTSVLCDWGIESKVVAVVRDNGTDITAALNRSHYEAIPCVAHTLQLVVKDGLINNQKVTNLLKKSKKLVGSFKHSAKNTKMLKTCQVQLGLPQHRMIQDEPTRWNSSFYMLKRIVEQKEAIILVSSKSEIKLSVDMVTDDWKTMQCAVSILEIFEQATLQVSKSTSSISEVIPLINTVKNVVENVDIQGSGLLGVKNDLLSSLKRRYPDVEANLTYACATVLDPRFKVTPFKNNRALENVKAKIVQEMLAITEDESSSVHVVQTTTTTSEGSDNSSKGLWSYYKDYFGKQVEEADDTASSCETELLQYLAEKNLDPKQGEKVPHYWANSTLSKLKKVAIKYLCIPPCTVYSERLFSTAGNISDGKRNRLDPDRVRMLVFLNKNIE